MSDHIPDKVMTKIFQRLSVNDLVRCRRVSKQWLAIVDSPHFISWKLCFPIHKLKLSSFPPPHKRASSLLERKVRRQLLMLG
ncbi:hypothetical protein LINPERHAP2_LOCUS5561 [Linum perenne]